jgi:hypothetical protein
MIPQPKELPTPFGSLMKISMKGNLPDNLISFSATSMKSGEASSLMLPDSFF